MKTLITLATSLVTFFVVTTCPQSTNTTTQPAEPITVQTTTAESSSYTGKVTLIHVNDIHGNAEETDSAIGYNTIAGFAEQMRSEDPNVIFVDAGDVFQGSPMAAFDKGESLVPVLNTVGFDVMVPGNSEYFLGEEQLTKLKDGLNYPMVVSNMLKEDGTPFADGYTILELEGGIKAGIIGVTTPGNSGTTNFTFTDPIESAKKLVAELEPQVDLLIALSHLGDAEADEFTSDRLAKEVGEFDIIVDAHSHTVLEEGKVINDVLIVQTGEYSNNIGVVELQFEKGILNSSSAKLIGKEDAASLPKKADTVAAMETLVSKAEAYFGEKVGKTSVDLVGTRDLIRTGETNMGNLFTDAMRAKAGTEVAMAVAGVIGGEIPPGDITREDILSIARISAEFYSMKVPGSAIVELINANLVAYPEPSGSFLQVSGISFKFDATEKKAYDVMVGDAPLEEDTLYTIALLDGLCAEPMMVGHETLGYEGYTDAAIEEYIVANSPISPKVEDRIVVTGK